MDKNYQPVIGLEVHVELRTDSKMFCCCSADYFGQEPNTHTCPVCLGLPGALPVPNKKAIDWCVMIGMALHCEIPSFAKFDRKNYFYPDLAKGYQISQFDEPFCINGYLDLRSGKRIRIRRVHMEEDTGKLTHSTVDGKKVSLVDFNRSGVPLVEIVTEPDFTSATEVKEYLQELQYIVRYLNVSNADMEKGNMRLEPNISLRPTREIQNPQKPIEEKDLPSYKVEVKNINSFRFVEKAITYEIDRQSKLLDEGQRPAQETRGWYEKKNATVSQRLKEEANDYRYFPEPDIPPIRWKKDQISSIKKQLPESRAEKYTRFMQDYGLSPYDSEILTREREGAQYFEKAVQIGQKYSISPKQIANAIINRKIDTSVVMPAGLIELITQETKLEPVDEGELDTIIATILAAHPKAIEDFKNGKEQALMFLLGQVMKEAKRKLDTQIIKDKIIATIK